MMIKRLFWCVGTTGSWKECSCSEQGKKVGHFSTSAAENPCIKKVGRYWFFFGKSPNKKVKRNELDGVPPVIGFPAVLVLLLTAPGCSEDMGFILGAQADILQLPTVSGLAGSSPKFCPKPCLFFSLLPCLGWISREITSTYFQKFAPESSKRIA